jgi:hypothetical protein
LKISNQIGERKKLSSLVKKNAVKNVEMKEEKIEIQTETKTTERRKIIEMIEEAVIGEMIEEMREEKKGETTEMIATLGEGEMIEEMTEEMIEEETEMIEEMTGEMTGEMIEEMIGEMIEEETEMIEEKFPGEKKIDLEIGEMRRLLLPLMPLITKKQKLDLLFLLSTVQMRIRLENLDVIRNVSTRRQDGSSLRWVTRLD